MTFSAQLKIKDMIWKYATHSSLKFYPSHLDMFLLKLVCICLKKRKQLKTIIQFLYS